MDQHCAVDLYQRYFSGPTEFVLKLKGKHANLIPSMDGYDSVDCHGAKWILLVEKEVGIEINRVRLQSR